MKRSILLAVPLLIAAGILAAVLLWRGDSTTDPRGPRNGHPSDPAPGPASPSSSGQTRPVSPEDRRQAAATARELVRRLEASWREAADPERLIPLLVQLEREVQTADDAELLRSLWDHARSQTTPAEIGHPLLLLVGMFRDETLTERLRSTLSGPADDRLRSTAILALLLTPAPPNASAEDRSAFWHDLLWEPSWSPLVYPGYLRKKTEERRTQGLRSRGQQILPGRLRGRDRVEFVELVVDSAPRVQDPEVRKSLLLWIALPASGHDRLVGPLLKGLSSEQDEDLRSIYFHYLSKLDEPAAVAELLKQARLAASDDLRATLMTQLGWRKIAGGGGGTLHATDYTGAPPKTRLALVRVAVADGGADAWGFVSKAIETEADAEVRAGAARWVATLGAESARERCFDALTRLVADGAPSVRIEALRGLAKLSSEESIRTLARVAASDPDPQVRETADSLYRRHRK